MENNTNENTVGLLSKLKAKLSTGKIVKAIACLTIAAGVAVGATCCARNKQPDSTTNPSQSTTLPGGSPTQPGQTTNPGQTTTSKNDYSQYSALLQSILENEEYDRLIANAINNPNALRSNYAPHPYGFLESEGYNIADIKNGTIKASTTSFVLTEEPNNLYVATYVETKSAKPYYTEYLLRYTLTDKEMKDYHMLHTNVYIESNFINEVISRTKTPTVINEVRCTVEAHDAFMEEFKNESEANVKTMTGGKKFGNMLFRDYSVEDGKFSIYILPDVLIFSTNMPRICSTSKIGVFHFKKGISSVGESADGAFYKPFVYLDFLYDESTDFNSGKEAIVYDPYRMYIDSFDYGLENDLNK